MSDRLAVKLGDELSLWVPVLAISVMVTVSCTSVGVTWSDAVGVGSAANDMD